MRTYFSNRIYKNELDKQVNKIIEECVLNYSYIRNYAFNLIRKEQMGIISFINTEEEPKNTLYLRLSNKFKTASVYLLNSAMQDAKAVYKSQKELNKLNIEVLEEKISKVNNKIQKVKQEKDTLQSVKNELKNNKNPISSKGRKYKLLDDNQIKVTIGKGKYKRETIYKDIYSYETEYLKNKQKQLKSRLGLLIFRRNKLQNKLNKISSSTYVPNVIFGSKKLQKQSVNDKSKRKEWLKRRYSRFEVSGKGDALVGNYVFLYSPDTKELTITLHKQKYIISNITFPYGDDYIREYYNIKKSDALIKNIKDKKYKKPITYSVEDKGKYYIVKCMLENKNTTLKNYSLSDGVIGVDTNLGFWSVSNVSENGNLLYTTNIQYDWKGKTSNQVSNNIENAVKELVDIAIREKKPIAIENLKFKGSKKIKDYNDNKSKNFLGNMFAYNKMTEALKSRANKMGVEIYEVNPSYTSLIGYVKYMPYYKLSIHNMASYVVGRRCLNYRETLPKNYKQFTDWATIYKIKNLKNK